MKATKLFNFVQENGVQKQCLNRLNQAIEAGLFQLRSGEKILAVKSYKRLKQKIKNAAKNYK